MRKLNKPRFLGRGRDLGEDENGSADRSPVEKPVGVLDTHVDTAVAAGGAEMVVPRGAVQTVTLIKIHSPGDIRNVVAWPGHAGRFELDVDGEVAGDGGVGGHACGDDELFLENTVFVSVGTLCREDDDDLLAHLIW